MIFLMVIPLRLGGHMTGFPSMVLSARVGSGCRSADKLERIPPIAPMTVVVCACLFNIQNSCCSFLVHINVLVLDRYDLTICIYIGQELDLPDVDNFKYRYYFTGATSDLSTLPSYPKPTQEYFPYTLNCYRGCLWDDLTSGDCTGSDGFDSDYEASATTGVTEMFTDYPTGSPGLVCDASASTDSDSTLVNNEAVSMTSHVITTGMLLTTASLVVTA